MDITKRKITKIAREVSKFTVRTLREEGIGTSEFDVIHVIRKNPGITQAEVSRRLGLDKGAVARQTANLEAKGYLRRSENLADGRSRLLYATSKADALKNSKAYVETTFYEWLLQGLTESEQETFAALLDTLYQRCKAESKADFPEMTQKMEEGTDHEEA